MAFLSGINSKAKVFLNSGFGTNSNSYGGRFLNKDGTANVQKRGMGFFDHISKFYFWVRKTEKKKFFLKQNI